MIKYRRYKTVSAKMTSDAPRNCARGVMKMFPKITIEIANIIVNLLAMLKVLFASFMLWLPISVETMIPAPTEIIIAIAIIISTTGTATPAAARD